MEDGTGRGAAADTHLVRLILEKFDALAALTAQLDDGTANTVLAVPGSNSVVQLLVHCCGLLRRWSSTVNLGVTIPRDRDAEFEAEMPVAAALALAAQTRAAFLADIAVTDLAAAPRLPPPDHDDFWTATCEGVLLHVLEELSQHLGHAEITRDLVPDILGPQAEECRFPAIEGEQDG
ncbi:DUF664 domain-containing protein [Brevibacterium album]|uniref:mycothiol transferase n=1 Tax=Brevibacterium album TaxID=417948 RepID=UPI0004080233|nr:DUF664 domain-containing protein [Brevibacterium album]